MVRLLTSSQESSASEDLWFKCRTCKQLFTGPFRLGLAKHRYDAVKNDHIASRARLLATTVLAQHVTEQGNHLAALSILNGLYVKLEEYDPHDPFLVTILLGKTTSLLNLLPTHKREYSDTLYKIVNSGLPETDLNLAAANNQYSSFLVLLADNGDLALAEKCARRSVSGVVAFRNLEGAPSIDEQEIGYENWLASVLSKRQKFVEALEIVERLRARALRVFGAEHDVSFVVGLNVSAVIVDSGTTARYEEAAENIRKLYEIRRAKYGEAHQETAWIRQHLREMLSRVGARCALPSCQSTVSVLRSQLRCPRCKLVKYCSAACLEADKARHPGSCKKK